MNSEKTKMNWQTKDPQSLTYVPDLFTQYVSHKHDIIHISYHYTNISYLYIATPLLNRFEHLKCWRMIPFLDFWISEVISDCSVAAFTSPLLFCKYELLTGEENVHRLLLVTAGGICIILTSSTCVVSGTFSSEVVNIAGSLKKKSHFTF